MLLLYAVSSLGPILIKELEISAGFLGYVILGSFGVASLLSLFAGNQLKRWGSRNALITIFLMVALSFGLMIFVSGYQGLMLAAVCCGIAQALANPATNLLITEKVSKSDRAFVVGLKQSGVQIAALFAGMVLPFLAIHWGWRGAIGVVIPFALIMVWATLFVTSEHQRSTSCEWKVPRPNLPLQCLMAIQCCVGISLSAFVTFIPLFASQNNFSTLLSGFLLAIFGTMGVFSRITLTPLSARLQDESSLLTLLTLVATSCLLLLLFVEIGYYWLVWLTVIGMGMTAVATNAIAMGMIVRSPDFGAVAPASGLLSFAFFGGFALGPAIFGYMLNAELSYFSGWILLASVMLLASIFSMALKSIRANSLKLA